MSRSAIAVVALFLGLALFSAKDTFFPGDPAPPPVPTNEPATPEATTETSPSSTKGVKLEPFPKFEGPRPKARSYGSTQDLVAALERRGIECTSLEFLEQEDPTLQEFSLCDPGTPERRFNIYFYPTPANRKLWIGTMRQQKLPLPLVYGPNWIIVAAGEPDTAMGRLRSIAGAVGGTIKDFSPNRTRN